ncbi:hypothetical protein GCM10009539_04960 [Cryptosporangium japonicum]|uniref:Uncharacterized protein n=1 Tax=Cryptosporangium japonicum TaxID=80872 RepID=A0ABN0TIT5_9ACTN
MLRLMSDYFCGFPVWDDLGLTTSPEALGVSTQLAARLYVWQEL